MAETKAQPLVYRKSKEGSKRPYLAAKVLTPWGVAQWPYLNAPQRVHDPDGTYKVDVVLDPCPELDALRAQLEELAAAHRTEFKVKPGTLHEIPIKEHEDKEGNKTGKFVIRTKLAAVVERDGDKIEQRPTVVDGKKNPIVPAPRVGAGTVLRVACDAISRVVKNVLYVTLNLRVVQIKTLVEWSGSDSPESYGMDEVPGEALTADGLDDVPEDGTGGNF